MPDSPAQRFQKSPRVYHTVAWVVLLVLTALLFARSYQCWGHPIIDLGRDLYLPAQLRSGRVLYRDIIYNYGPLAPYSLAAVTAVLGDDLWVFAAVGVATGLATMVAVYLIGLRFGGIGVAFISAVLFAILNDFAWFTFGCNFVMPYSYAATFAAALVLWSFEFLLRYLNQRQRKHFVYSVGLLYLTFLTKQEFALAIAAVHLVAWCTQDITRKSKLATLGGGAFLAAAMLAIFTSRGPDEYRLFTDNLLRLSGSSTAASFFRLVAGLNQPVEHLFTIAVQTGILFAVILGINVLWSLAEQFRFPRRVAMGLCSLAMVLATPFFWQYADVRLYSIAPFVALGMLGVLLFKDRRDPLLLLSVLVLATALRTPLTYGPLWYGFALAIPAYPFLAHLFAFRLAPRLPGPGITITALVFLTALVAAKFDYGRNSYSLDLMTSTLTTPKGTMHDIPIGRAEAIQRFLTYVNDVRPSKPQTMVVFPEGVSLNYFSDIPNPTGYYLFIPPEIGSPEIEQSMIADLERTKPECVVVTSRDVREFGVQAFGRDYAVGLGQWITANYELERTFPEDNNNSWRLYLFRRK